MSTLPARLVVLAFALGLLSPAHALGWTPSGAMWLPDEMPIPYQVADDGAPNSLAACESSNGLSGCCEETVPQGYCATAAAEGFAAWAGASCGAIEVDDRGPGPNIASVPDGYNRITFDDPGDQIAELGTFAVSIMRWVDPGPGLPCEPYEPIEEVDIVFNDQIGFASHEQILAGDCAEDAGTANFRAVMTHEIGHFFGLDHSCEDPTRDDGPCDDPESSGIMDARSVRPCSDEVELTADDIAGIRAVYGRSATFECSNELGEYQAVGVVPFDLHCVIVSPELREVVGTAWDFGDGGTSTERNPTHTYTEPGNYTVGVTVRGENEGCDPDGGESRFEREDYVRACGPPDPLFEVRHVDGLEYQLWNESPLGVAGCVSDIQWQVFEGRGTGGREVGDPIGAWEPVVVLPEEGEYTAVLNLGGLAGTRAAAATFDTRADSTCSGCSTGSSGSGLALVLAGAVAITGRRPGRPRR